MWPVLLVTCMLWAQPLSDNEIDAMVRSGVFRSRPLQQNTHTLNSGPFQPISLTTFIERFGARVTNSPTQLSVHDIFTQLDMDADGLIDRSEIAQFKYLVPAQPLTKLRFTTQFSGILQQHCQHNRTCLEAVFGSADINLDGILSPKEQRFIHELAQQSRRSAAHEL